MENLREMIKKAEDKLAAEKEAGLFDAIKGGVSAIGRMAKAPSLKDAITQGLMLGTASAAVTGGAALTAGLTDVIGGKLQKKVGIRRMYRENPWLDKEDKKTVSKFYDTLHRFSPNMAMDPLVAGSFMKKQLEFKDIGIQPNDLQTITSIEKAKRDAKGSRLLMNAFSPAAMGAVMPHYRGDEGPAIMGS